MDTDITVVCRVRPLSKSEGKDAGLILGPAQVIAPQKSLTFNFDRVHRENTSQVEFFNETCLPMIKHILEGYNCTILAYGQTGSGKSFTMTGYSPTGGNSDLYRDKVSLWKTDEDMGVIPRTIKTLFTKLPPKTKCTISLSYVEIYLETVRDLIDTSRNNLMVREMPEGIVLDGVIEPYVSTYEEALRIIHRGERNRAVAATNMNEQSSRSHSVITLKLCQTEGQTVKKSKIVFVDLAGSERASKTGATGIRLQEASATNTSLTALGNVIRALTSKNPGHIPYRDSKLTRLLTESLGGNSKTCLIIACSPSMSSIEETISSLRFGTQAKLIKNRAIINADRSVDAYRQLYADQLDKEKLHLARIHELEQELVRLSDVCSKQGIVKTFQSTSDAKTLEELTQLRKQLEHERNLKDKYYDDLSELRSQLDTINQQKLIINESNSRIEDLESQNLSLAQQVLTLEHNLICQKQDLQTLDNLKSEKLELAEEETRQRRIVDSQQNHVAILQKTLQEMHENHNSETQRYQQTIEELRRKLVYLSSK